MLPPLSGVQRRVQGDDRSPGSSTVPCYSNITLRRDRQTSLIKPRLSTFYVRRHGQVFVASGFQIVSNRTGVQCLVALYTTAVQLVRVSSGRRGSNCFCYGTNPVMKGIIRCLVATDDNHDKTSGTTYCDSVECLDGYALIDDAANEECEMGTCQESRCCNTLCSGLDCPAKYSLVNNSGAIVCGDSGCTDDLYCEMGKIFRKPLEETSFTRLWRVTTVQLNCKTGGVQ